MKFTFLLPTLAFALMSANAFAQHVGHADVEFGYDDLATPTLFEIEIADLTSDGFGYFESEMEELDPFSPGDFSSDEPGFVTSALEGLLVNEDDRIWLRALDASATSSFGVGFVNFYNPLTDALEVGGRMAIYDKSSETADLILDGTSIESGNNPQFLALGGSNGDVHDHLIIDLLDDGSAPEGAYGIMFQMQADFAPADSAMDLSSDPFWIVFNHGLSETEFETQALPRFGIGAVAVPEPNSLTLIGLGFAATLFRRRKA